MRLYAVVSCLVLLACQRTQGNINAGTISTLTVTLVFKYSQKGLTSYLSLKKGRLCSVILTYLFSLFPGHEQGKKGLSD